MSNADPLIGRVIAGKMELLELLGSGAMGKVFRAHHRGLDKMVAIKVLHPETGAAPALAARFKAEARAASRLDHPNSLQVLDFGEDTPDALLYLAMELLDGETLQSLLSRQRKLSPTRAAWIMGQVCSALAAAHDQGIVHRDVKPANVMLTIRRGDGGLITDFVKVCDFGLAKVLDASPERSSSGPVTQQGVVVGTPAYMSPEQAKGEAVDHRSDLYSCGVLLYRMLSGQKPFDGETAWAVSLKQITEEPRPIRALAPELSEALATVVHRAMAKDPEARFSSARELKAHLAEAAGVELDSSTVETAMDATYVPPTQGASHLAGHASQAYGLLVPSEAPRARWPVAVGVVLLAAATAGVFLLHRASTMAAAAITAEPLAPPPFEPATPLEPIEPVALEIAGAPPGTRVFADGALLGSAPGPLALPRGERAIVLRFEAAGHEPLQRSVLPTRDLSLTIALRPLATQPAKHGAERRRTKHEAADRHSLENPFP